MKNASSLAARRATAIGLALRPVHAAGRRVLSSSSEAAKSEEVKTDAAPKQAKKQFKDSDKRWKAKKAALASREKTALCPQHVATGKCENPKCYYAHSLAELKTPAYFAQAEAAAAQEARPITADDLLFARAEAVFRKGSGFKSLVENMGIQAATTSVAEWSQAKLDMVRLVEKASLTVPISALKNNWNLSPVEETLLKQVVGPRYDPETNTFKLVKRNRKPYSEELNEDVVYDPLIKTLVQVVQEVKKHAPKPYADAVNVAPVARYPKISITVENVE